MKYVIALVFIALVGTIWLVIIAPKCLQSHEEPRHQDAYTSFMVVGKVLVPLFHPANDYQVDVCDKYETK